jgi:hypothetical protein
MRESDIEDYLVYRARGIGGEVRKVKWIGRSGAPDRVLMLPWASGLPSTIWVECKATGKLPTDAQAREHDRMRNVGQRVEVVDSFEAVDALFE